MTSGRDPLAFYRGAGPGAKLQLYCRYGVQECWLVDPEERTVEALALSPQGYQVLGQYGQDEMVSSQVLVGFQCAANEIFG